ncbi:MAG TPA: response regulator transcription factor [Acidimicrobiales bacterium]|nr:response regulator transcription factor [Acidimicrobiales bacterium]
MSDVAVAIRPITDAVALRAVTHASYRVLVVQGPTGDEDRAGMLTKVLESEGYDVELAVTAAESLHRFSTSIPDLVVLGTMPGPTSWIEMYRQMREVADVPVVIGFPLQSQIDAVVAFEMGVAGYVSDPTRLQELVARIRVALRGSRTHHVAPTVVPWDRSGTYTAGRVRIDVGDREVTVDGDAVHLSRLELDLLMLLVSPPGQVHTREEITRTVWAGRPCADSRTLDTHIRWLRQKLEDDPTHPKYLITVRGVGFRFDASEADGS